MTSRIRCGRVITRGAVHVFLNAGATPPAKQTNKQTPVDIGNFLARLANLLDAQISNAFHIKLELRTKIISAWSCDLPALYSNLKS